MSVIFLFLFFAVTALSVARQEQSRQQSLLNLANHHFTSNNADSALFYYNKVVEAAGSGSEVSDADRKNAVIALNRIGVINLNKGNYLRAYRSLIEALTLCETYGIVSEQSRIYNNMGNVYFHFRKYAIAEKYYRQALS